MRFSSLYLLPLLFVGLVLTGCDSSDPVSEEPGDLEVPATYTFDSRFVDGESAVAYPGQVTRNLLIADIKTLTDARATAADLETALLDRYTYNAQDLDILLSTDPSPLQSTYPDIATDKSLKGKVQASYSADVDLIGLDELPGFGSDVTVDQVIDTYLRQIADNYAAGQTAPEAYTTDEGIDMGQIVNKLLLGAVAYSQGTSKYLAGVLNQTDSPNTQDGDKPYSTMGHVWDEAYGYYGAARDFSSGDYYDTNGMVSNAADLDGDGSIDLESEFVFTWADYSVDRGTVSDSDFHTSLFESFREGRTAIINQESIESIQGHAADARSVWDDVVAANVVHYLNAMESDLSGLADDDVVTRDALGADGTASFNEHWGEAKPFAWALQYNPDKKISDADLEALHAELGGQPPYGQTKSEVVASINAAKDLIQNADYDFSDTEMDSF